eukprot:7132114-Pyramimonas_sp.AAC.1
MAASFVSVYLISSLDLLSPSVSRSLDVCIDDYGLSMEANLTVPAFCASLLTQPVSPTALSHLTCSARSPLEEAASVASSQDLGNQIR